MGTLLIRRYAMRIAFVLVSLFSVFILPAPRADALTITSVAPNLSVAFNFKQSFPGGPTQWIYAVTNSGMTTAYNIKFSYTFYEDGPPPGTKAGSFTIAKVPAGASWNVAVTCNNPATSCKNSTIKIEPGNYLISLNQGTASAP